MRFDTVQNALDALGRAVAVNVLLVLTASPLIALLLFTDAFASWPFVAIALVVAAPGMTAAFTAFRRDDENAFRAFAHGYRTTWRRATLLALGLVACAAVLIVDVRVFADGPFAQAAMVVLVVTGVLVAGTGLVAMAAVAEDPGIRLRDAVRRAAWLGLRRWYLTLASLGVMVVFATIFVSIPLLAISALASPALYLVWSNSRFTLRPLLDVADVAV